MNKNKNIKRETENIDMTNLIELFEFIEKTEISKEQNIV